MFPKAKASHLLKIQLWGSVQIGKFWSRGAIDAEVARDLRSLKHSASSASNSKTCVSFASQRLAGTKLEKLKREPIPSCQSPILSGVASPYDCYKDKHHGFGVFDRIEVGENG